MKKVLVFCTAFMFAAINICSAQAERTEKRANDGGVTNQNSATEVVRPDAATPSAAEAATLKPSANEAATPQPSAAESVTPKPAASDAVTPKPTPAPQPKPAPAPAPAPKKVTDDGKKDQNAKKQPEPRKAKSQGNATR
ncbi:MAG: hypothetical protein FWF09_03575 [Bacteroidales bacterium]|nr:hypothetical protein [Bacteroidales bacterium]